MNQFSVAAPHMQTTQQGYFSTLTALRGIAAIWVMLFHMDVIIYYRELGTLLPKSHTGIVSQGYLWVDFFFLLSGFVLMHVYSSRFEQGLSPSLIKRYLMARFFRIYPLHLFTLFLLAIFVVVTSQLLPQVMDGSWVNYFDEQAFVANLLLLNAVGTDDTLSWNIVSWSIGAEWWVYIVAIGLFFTINVKHPIRTLLVAIVNGVALVLLVQYSDNKNLDITFDRGVLRCLFEFTLGCCLYVVYQRRLGCHVLASPVLFVGNLLMILAVLHWRLMDLLIIPLFGLLILTSIENKSVVNKVLMQPVLQYLGKISYSIYMMHGVCFMLFWFLLPELTRYLSISQLSSGQILLFCLSFLALTLGSAALTFNMVEVPGRTLYRRFFFTTPKSDPNA